MQHDDSPKYESIADHIDMSVETQQLVIGNRNIHYYDDITMDFCKGSTTNNDDIIGGSYPTIPITNLTLSSSSYLYDYQIDFIQNKFEINNSRLLFADEMGLGKTIATIMAFKFNQSKFNNLGEVILIISMPALFGTWLKEINKSYDITVIGNNNNNNNNGINNSNNNINPLKTCVISNKNNEQILLATDFNIHDYNYILISYTALHNYFKKTTINDNKFKNVKNIILDESHHIKTCSIKANKSNELLLNFIKSIDISNNYNTKIILISATPIITIADNGPPVDLFNTFYLLLDKSVLIDDNLITLDYLSTHYNSYIASLQKKPIEYFKKYLDVIMVRRTIEYLIEQKCITGKLPTKFIHQVKIDSSDELLVSTVPTPLLLPVDVPMDDNDNDNVASLEIIRNGISKANFLVNMITLHTDNVFNNNITSNTNTSKIIIFFYHTAVGDHLANQLTNNNIKTFLINGTIDFDDRDDIIEEYKYYNGSCVLLVSLMTCSYGINLVTRYCAQIHFCELSYNPGLFIQAEGRIVRLNNEYTNEVHIFYYIILGTHDERIMNDFLDRKHKYISDIIKLSNHN